MAVAVGGGGDVSRFVGHSGPHDWLPQSVRFGWGEFEPSHVLACLRSGGSRFLGSLRWQVPSLPASLSFSSPTGACEGLVVDT